MKEIRKLKTVIIGCGKICGIYLKNLKSRFSVIDLIAIADLDIDARDEMAQKYNVDVMDLESVYCNPNVEMIINLTPPQAHFNVIKKALNNNKHVYTEKPLCTTLSDAKEVCTLADEKGLYLGSAPDTFLGASAQTAKFAIDNNLIGKVTSCSFTLNRDGALMADKYPYTAKEGGGIGLDVGIYYMTTLLSILGPIKECCGYMETLNPNRTHLLTSKNNFLEKYKIESENMVVGSYKFESGVFGSLHINANSIQSNQPGLIIFGTEGIIYLPDPNNFGGEVKVELKGSDNAFVLPHTHSYCDNSRGLGAAEMAWSIINRRKNRSSKELAYHALEFLLGIQESGRTNQFYKMKSTFELPSSLKRGLLDQSYHGSEPEGSIAL